MANREHLTILKQGVEAWNKWRDEHPDTMPDLSGEDLSGLDLNLSDLHGVNLRGADLRGVNFSNAKLARAYLREANFSPYSEGTPDERGANLSGAVLWKADLYHANLHRAELRDANLRKAILFEADLREAKICGANLTGTLLVDADLKHADLTGCFVYGASVWNVNLEGAIQSNLILIDAPGKHDWKAKHKPTITVDRLEIAQLIYLLLNNRKIGEVIDTIGKKAVLILGRFSPERKAILDAIRHELRKRNYLPVLFDFEKPGSRDLTETISTLAHMARFVIADITDAKSIPQELTAIVPNLPSVPVQPLLLASQHEYGMFEHFRRYPWVLEPFLYEDQEKLLAELQAKVLAPAEAKAKELTGR
jgi:uncharacterized protein YjbI with pentapeptide repeats